MRVCDYQLDFSTRVYTCCMDEIENNKQKAFAGMKITCDNCGVEMTLLDRNGTLMWCGDL
jgi:hypothetical protein